MSTTKYYQLGGFRPDIRWFEGDWNDQKLVDLLAGPDSPLRSTDGHPLELVLGIKTKGTSHLLLADSQANAFERKGNRRPYHANTIADYASVSPIYFNSASELRQKLGVLKPKARKGKKQEAWDSSQANKAYTDGNQGISRGEFEHGRVLYRLLRKTINPAVYSLPDITWTQNLHIISFVCNLRAADFRPHGERQRAPRPLDYGWAEANASDSRLSVKQGSAVHLIRAEDRLLKTGRRDVPFEHGSTQVESQERITSLAQAFFGALQGEQAEQPTILLVHNENLARNALRELGVDTSTWSSGIADLLRPKVKPEPPNVRQPPVASSSQGRCHNSASNFEQRQQRPRDRSKSPVRGIKPDPGGLDRQSYTIRRSPPVTGRRKHPPVYVVDVQALYWTMMQSQTEKLLGGIAEKLGVLEDGNSCCAGNEAVYIFQVWHLMISGAAIDEQRAARIGSKGPTAIAEQTDATEPSVSFAAEDSDEEFDPNDIIQVSSAAQNDGNNDDSETDYGSDY